MGPVKHRPGQESVQEPVEKPVPRDQRAPEERRKGKRVALGFAIEITGSDRQGQPFAERTRTLDVSESGCSFPTDLPLSRGDTVSIRVMLPGGIDLFLEETAYPFEIMWVDQSGKRRSVGARKLVASKPWKAVTFPPEKLTLRPE